MILNKTTQEIIEIIENNSFLIEKLPKFRKYYCSLTEIGFKKQTHIIKIDNFNSFIIEYSRRTSTLVKENIKFFSTKTPVEIVFVFHFVSSSSGVRKELANIRIETNSLNVNKEISPCFYLSCYNVGHIFYYPNGFNGSREFDTIYTNVLLYMIMNINISYADSISYLNLVYDVDLKKDTFFNNIYISLREFKIFLDSIILN